MADDGLVSYLRDAVAKAGGRSWRLQCGSAHGHRMRLCDAGTADTLVALPRRPLTFVECKRKDGELSVEQAEFRVWCLEHGYAHEVVYDRDDVARLVEGSRSHG